MKTEIKDKIAKSFGWQSWDSLMQDFWFKGKKGKFNDMPFDIILDKLLDEASQRQPVSVWISVKDRLPESGQRVLVISPEHYITDEEHRFMGIYWKDSKSWTVYDVEPELGVTTVTHWQPLSAPPSNNDKKQ